MDGFMDEFRELTDGLKFWGDAEAIIRDFAAQYTAPLRVPDWCPFCTAQLRPHDAGCVVRRAVEWVTELDRKRGK
jgi:hypothetical protein